MGESEEEDKKETSYMWTIILIVEEALDIFGALALLYVYTILRLHVPRIFRRC